MNLFTAAILGISIALSLLVGQAFAQDYDVVILNGRVMDPETSFDKIRNVGVKNGKIATITKDAIEGAEIIDASGHVVSPGFIDGHVHIVDSPLGQKGALRDGVTTTLDLEAGAYPVDQWYDQLAGRSQTNYGASVSVVGARTAVFRPQFKSTSNAVADVMIDPKGMGADWVVRLATPKERDEILGIIEYGLRRGGLGVGPPAGYMTEGFSSEELLGIQKLAAKYGRFTHIHTRFSSQISPTSAILAFQEAIAPAVAYGGGVIIAHFTAQALAQTEASIDFIEDLRASGMPVVLEVYPYNFGAASLQLRRGRKRRAGRLLEARQLPEEHGPDLQGHHRYCHGQASRQGRLR
jgi:N-acyl-D-glutamate deacylase